MATSKSATPVHSGYQHPTPARIAVLLLCLIGAAAAVRRIAALLAPGAGAGPPEMQELDADFLSQKALVLSHIVPALLFVGVLAVKVVGRGRLSATAQRRLTYALFLLGVVVGATALLLSLHPVGGAIEASAVIFYDALFLASLARAWVLLRRDDLARYREWMVRAVAVLLGIATTRPVMGVFFATERITHMQPSQFFGIAFWIGFTVTYLAGEVYLRTRAL